MTIQREKFSTQMDARLLEELRKVAKAQGRQLQSVIEDAVAAWLNTEQDSATRPEIKCAFETSTARFPETYKKLAQ